MDQDLASIAEARSLLRRTRQAFERFKTFDQARVDRITYAAVEAGYARGRAARAARGRGDRHRAASTARPRRTGSRRAGSGPRSAASRRAGSSPRTAASGVMEVADPFGVVAAIIPTTNPTSTALFKAIICLKSRNGMVASPHPRSVRCVGESIKVVQEAAAAAGAPADILTCMTTITLEGTQALMKHDDCDLILATGGSALVHEAYSSGQARVRRRPRQRARLRRPLGRRRERGALPRREPDLRQRHDLLLRAGDRLRPARRGPRSSRS